MLAVRTGAYTCPWAFEQEMAMNGNAPPSLCWKLLQMSTVFVGLTVCNSFHLLNV